MRGALTGTGAMLRLVLRRDRVRLPVWILAVAGLLISSVASVPSLYATEADRLTYTAAVGDNPVAVIMGGPGAGLPSLGGIVVFEMGIVGYLAVGLMSVLLVVRHSRAEEETGRTELLRATVVGRYAGPVAALLAVAGAGVAVAGIVAVAMIVVGLPVAGSIALTASVAVLGLTMAAVAALAAQVTEHARAASGLAVTVLAAFFVLRAAGDVGNAALSWFSPMGWAIAVRPFAGERWAILLLPLGLALAVAAAALMLVDRRDVGAGLVPVRTGRGTASRWLSGTFGLALRQYRASLAGWAVGLFILGLAYGSVGEAVEELVGQNDALAEFVAADGASLVDSFFAVAAVMVALLAGGFALQTSTRLRSEETAGRLEAVLGAAVPRWRWAGSHLLVAAAGSAGLLLAAGLGLGLGYAIQTGDVRQIGRLVAATLVYVPAVWTLVGIVAAVFGLLPRAVAAGWAVLVLSAFVALLGRSVRPPDWVMKLSPFQHTPQLPSEALSVVPLAVVTFVAIALMAGGVFAFHRRDIG